MLYQPYGKGKTLNVKIFLKFYITYCVIQFVLLILVYQIKTIKKMETLRFKRVGYGNYIITLEINNRILATTTTNSLAIDCAFDDNYDLYNNEGRFYESQEEARQSLINQIIRDNDECI